MSTANPNRRVFWAGLLLILAALTVTAQEFRGSFAGKINDPNGVVVPGSKVEIKNVETGIVYNTMTGEDGAYSFPLLPPGKYQLTVTKENFNTAVRDGIEVRVADRLTLDVQLEIGMTAMVTTVASALTLDTGMVQTGTVVTGKQISELPLTEGTAYQLATLAPGIAYTGNPLFTGPTSNANLAAFRSNGATGANQITLDGSPNYAFDGTRSAGSGIRSSIRQARKETISSRPLRACLFMRLRKACAKVTCRQVTGKLLRMVTAEFCESLLRPMQTDGSISREP